MKKYIKSLLLTSIIITLPVVFLRVNAEAVMLEKEQPKTDKSANLLSDRSDGPSKPVKETGRGKSEYAPGEVIIKFKAAPLAEALRTKTLQKQKEAFSLSGQELSQTAKFLNKIIKAGTKAEPVFKGLYNQMKQTNKTEVQLNQESFNKLSKQRPMPQAQPKNHNLSNVYILKNLNAEAEQIEEICQELSSDPNIEYAEPNYKVRIQAYPQTLPNDTYVDPDQDGIWSTGAWPGQTDVWDQPYADLWGLKKIQADEAWKISQGFDVVVAVVDTGVDYNHEDITGNIWINPINPGEDLNQNGIVDPSDFNGIDDDNNGYIDDIRGYDFVNDDTNPIDDHGHGTHVAGTIAAIGNNGKGIIGIAPGAKIMAVKGLDMNGNGFISSLANCIRYAAYNGANVINNSWGGIGSSAVIEEAVNYAHSCGCVVVAAAGNDRKDAAWFFPANCANAVTVGATNQDDERCRFSNYGAKVDVFAPGGGAEYNPDMCNMLSLLAYGSFYSTPDSGLTPYIIGGKYLRIAGTSMAAPHVSGLAALILSKRPFFNNEEVRQVLRSSADQGRINAYNALQVSSVCIARISSPRNYDMFKAGPIPIFGSAYGAYFSRYRLEYWDSSTQAWVEIANSNTSVINGLLGNLNTTDTASYFIKLTVIDTNNNEFQFSIAPLTVYANLHDGWPKSAGSSCYGMTPTPFVVGDVDNDGKKEIIIGTIAGTMHIFKENGQELNGWPKEMGSAVRSDISLEDINADGKLEIFFACYNQYVYGYYSNGQAINGWPQRIIESDYLFYNILISDVDKCGNAEIVILPTYPYSIRPGDNRYYAYIFKRDGSLFSKWVLFDYLNTYLAFNAGGCVGDINKDNKLEIIVPLLDTRDSNFYLHVFDYAGNVLAKLPLDGITAQVVRNNGYIWVSAYPSLRPVLGDLNNDANLEICIVSTDINSSSKLFVWSYDYSHGAYIPMAATDFWPNQDESPISLADIDNNGDLEIVCALNSNSDPTIKVLNHDGTLLWEKSDTDLGSIFFNAPPIIGDIDGDSEKEIIMADDSAPNSVNLHIYHYNTPFKEAYMLSSPILRGMNYCPPVITDMDNDGYVELIGFNPTNGLVAVWDLSSAYDIKTMDWSMYQHDPQHTGMYSPTAPTIITAAYQHRPAPSKVMLTWRDNSNIEQGFKIERSIDNGATWYQIYTVGANVTGYWNIYFPMATNKQLTYRVKAYNSSATSAPSNAVTVGVRNIAYQRPVAYLDPNTLAPRVEDPTYCIARGYNKEKLVDENTSSLAYPAAREFCYEINLEDSYIISQIKLTWGYYGSIQGQNRYVTSWKAQAYRGNAWQQIGSGGIPGIVTTINTSLAGVSKIRVFAWSDQNWIGINELELSGQKK